MRSIIDTIYNEQEQPICMWDSFGKFYPKGELDNPSVISSSIYLTQSLVPSINEKRDNAVTL